MDRAPTYAHPVVEILLQRVDALAATPRVGRRLAEFAGDEVREVMEPPFRVIYRLNGDLLEVLTVKHYHQRLIQAPNFEG